MKKTLIISFGALMVMLFVMKWQNTALVTPLSPRGLIDLELARTPGKWTQLRLFWNAEAVLRCLYFNFLLIGAYGWFLFTACHYIHSKTGWMRKDWPASIALSAACFDVLENLLLIFLVNGHFSTEVIAFVFYLTLLKFVLVAIVIGYLLLSWPFALRRRKR